ncbi:ribonuclease H-like domain-containing protein [Obelidium mucronatum]|nr:ribonuclease H-like domain-containing protein [Obelidium mucronatum]
MIIGRLLRPAVRQAAAQRRQTTATRAAKPKAWSSPAFNTPAERLTEQVVAALAERRLYPHPLVSTLNPNAHVFTIDSLDAADTFVSAVLQISSRNNNAFSVLGLDVEYTLAEPVLLQLAFSAEIVVLFQISVIASSSTSLHSSYPFSSALKSVLESPHIRKSGVSILNDCNKLLKTTGVETKNIADCKDIAESMNVGARSLASIYYTFVDQTSPFKNLSREPTGFNWNSLELEPAAIEYAANDALASLLVYRAMANQTVPNTFHGDKPKSAKPMDYSPPKEEEHWKEFRNVRDKYNLTAKRPSKPLPNALPSSLSGSNLSFAELPDFNATPTPNISLTRGIDYVTLKGGSERLRKSNSRRK